MAAASFDLSKLLDDATQEGIVAPLLKDGKDRGELRFDVNYYPVVEPEEGKEEILDSSTFFSATLLLLGTMFIARTSFFFSCRNRASHRPSSQGTRPEQVALRRPQPTRPGLHQRLQ